MTDQELLGAARQTLNMARTDWELQGWPTSMVIASYHATDVPPLHRMRKIEQLLQEKLGKGWLDDEAKKDHGFYVLRLATLAMPPDAVVIATPTDVFRTTEKFKLRGEAAKRATDTREKRRQLVAEGRMELVDSVCATAQTPERICTVAQPVRRGVYVGEPTVTYWPQAQFDGRMKMFGAKIAGGDMEAVERFREVLEGARRKRETPPRESE
jgi:hypothetical protein